MIGHFTKDTIQQSNRCVDTILQKTLIEKFIKFISRYGTGPKNIFVDRKYQNSNNVHLTSFDQ